jgi:minor extracellular serine protease Vpr
VYALGPTDASGDGKNGTDIRAAGVQVLPYDFLDSTADPSDRSIVFAVNMHDRFSTAAPHEIDVAVDTNGDGSAEYVVFGYDYGYMTTGAYSGMYVSFVEDLALKEITNAWLADAPLNGSTVLLPALASDLGLAAGASAFTYKVVAYDGFTADASDSTYSSRSFDAYAPKQSTGQFKKVNARSSTYISAWFNRVSTVRGWLVVSMDDRNGYYQADVVSPPSKP